MEKISNCNKMAKRAALLFWLSLCAGAGQVVRRIAPSRPVRAELFEGGRAAFELVELVPYARYEVRLSYAASSPMRFGLRLSTPEAEAAAAAAAAVASEARRGAERPSHLRRLLNTEKLLLGTEEVWGGDGSGGGGGGGGGGGALLLAVTAQREGVTPEGERRAPSSTVFELHLERLVFGLPLTVWRLVALLAVSVPSALCFVAPALQAALLARLDESAGAKASRRH